MSDCVCAGIVPIFSSSPAESSLCQSDCAFPRVAHLDAECFATNLRPHCSEANLFQVKGSNNYQLQTVAMRIVSMEGFTSTTCRQNCGCQSIPIQQTSTAFNDRHATSSTSITWNPQLSTDFNKAWNLVRDQGVGGSNPLSPTNVFNEINSISGIPVASRRQICDRGILANLQ